MSLPSVCLFLCALWATAQSDEICCDGLGCFTDDYPFDHLPLPNCHTPTFALYTRSNSNSPQYITRTNIPGAYDGSKQTIYTVHGWNSNEQSGWMHNNKDALLAKADVNVVVVGWGGVGGAGNPNYIKAAATTRAVGAEIGLITDKLVSETSASYGQMYCIGHSLGAHTCGHAGRAANGNFGRITGLDPAGPNFENFPNQAGLYTDSANFVDVIHTNGQDGFPINYGTNKQLGHMDFYPEAGSIQPGCRSSDLTEEQMEEMLRNPLDIDTYDQCSHSIAHSYMEASIENDCFEACGSCTDWENLPGSCSGCGGCGIMGYGAQTGGGGNGMKLVDVGANAPYCQGSC